MLKIPDINVPIVELPIPNISCKIFLKREDLIDPEISGNKYWKLFYNVNHYLQKNPSNPLIITFGGAFSNHISAVSAFGKRFGIKTIGFIRGEELVDKWRDNPTLNLAHSNGMSLHYISREDYRNKEKLAEFLLQEFPNALIIPEGGTNQLAVEGVKMMLDERTKDFDYLCTAVGTGGTLAGLSNYCEPQQQIIGCKVVNDDTINDRLATLSSKENYLLIDSFFGGYGKINEEVIRFINDFSNQYAVPLDPVYTGKMMMSIMTLVEENYFPENARILCFHTGGLQGIEGANKLLEKQNRTLLIN